MKNKIMLIIIALSIGLQSNMVLGSAAPPTGYQPTIWEKIKRMFSVPEKERARLNETLPARRGAMAVGAGVGAGLMEYGSTISSRASRALPYLSGWNGGGLLAVATGSICVALFTYAIREGIARYQYGTSTRAEAVQDVKDGLVKLISNDLLFPTYYLKTEALTDILSNRSIFTKYQDDLDTNGLIKEAAIGLLKEMETEHRNKNETIDRILDNKIVAKALINKEDEIDAQINSNALMLKNKLHQYKTLAEKLKTLDVIFKEGMTPFDPNKAQAYLSVYRRLEAEAVLTEEQLARRTSPWLPEEGIENTAEFKTRKEKYEEAKQTPKTSTLVLQPIQ